MKTKQNLAAQGLAAFGLAALPLAVQAQATAVDTVALNPMVVTATLAPRTADETLSSVTVLDEATLRRQDPTSVTDLLRGQPGVDVTTNGSFGKNSSVYLRGTGNESAVLMIDGIRLRSATSGAQPGTISTRACSSVPRSCVAPAAASTAPMRWAA